MVTLTKPMKIALVALVVIVVAFLVYKYVIEKKPAPTGGVTMGPGPASTPASGTEHGKIPQMPPAGVTSNSQEAVGSCPALGQAGMSAGSTNITAAMGAARPMVSLTSPCQAGSNSGMNVAPASVSPWVSDMFAGSVAAMHSHNPSDVNSVFDQSTMQTLDPSGDVGFGMVSGNSSWAPTHGTKDAPQSGSSCGMKNSQAKSSCSSCSA